LLEQICPIWGTPAEVGISNRDGRDVDSPRAGGKYFISRSLANTVRNYADTEKVRLTNWLVREREEGTEFPELLSGSLSDALKHSRNSVAICRDRLMLWLESKSETIGHKCFIENQLEDYPND
jgi:hypothetical protein